MSHVDRLVLCCSTHSQQFGWNASPKSKDHACYFLYSKLPSLSGGYLLHANLDYVNNISSICICRCNKACFAMVAVIGLMTTETLYFHFTMSFWVIFWGSGAIFWAARASLLLKENNYSIGSFKERSFVGNYVSDSLHLTLAVVTYSHCRQQTNSEICSVNET